MKVGVIGVGHVGLVTTAYMADIGHDVVGVNSEVRKIETPAERRVRFYEPGLAELVSKDVNEGRIRSTNNSRAAIAGAAVVFVCDGTRREEDGAPNLSSSWES